MERDGRVTYIVADTAVMAYRDDEPIGWLNWTKYTNHAKIIGFRVTEGEDATVATMMILKARKKMKEDGMLFVGYSVELGESRLRETYRTAGGNEIAVEGIIQLQ